MINQMTTEPVESKQQKDLHWRDRLAAKGGPAHYMTLRDAFAMQALPEAVNQFESEQKAAQWSYRMADAMLEARKSEVGAA